MEEVELQKKDEIQIQMIVMMPTMMKMIEGTSDNQLEEVLVKIHQRMMI